MLFHKTPPVVAFECGNPFVLSASSIGVFCKFCDFFCATSLHNTSKRLLLKYYEISTTIYDGIKNDITTSAANKYMFKVSNRNTRRRYEI